MTTRVKSDMVLLEGSRNLETKLGELINAADYGATTSGAAGANSTAINLAIQAAKTQGGFVLINPGVSYTESSLTLEDNVSVLIFGIDSTITILSKDQGSSPITKGGLVIKSKGSTGVILRNTDYGVIAEPMLQLVDRTNGDLASLELRFVEMEEVTDPAAPSANKARLYLKDNGAGKTQLTVRFPTGNVVPLAAQDQTVGLTASAVYDPASIADGAGVTTTVTCTGAVLGDFTLAAFSQPLQGILVTSWVSAADVVSVRFQNESGGAVDLASGTLTVRVLPSI